MKKYLCLICGLIYDESKGWPEDDIEPGTKWEDVLTLGCVLIVAPQNLTLI
jgi:rubredoxin